MEIMRIHSRCRILQACGLAAVLVLGLLALREGAARRAIVHAAPARAGGASSEAQTPADPWTAAETVAPADLVKELGDSDPAKRPVVACVGFKFLYDGGHVPGASFHGPASKDEGLADLKK